MCAGVRITGAGRAPQLYGARPDREHPLFGCQDAESYRNFKSLVGYRVAAEEGAYAIQEMQRRNIDTTLIENNSEAEALQRVARREADYAFVPTHIGYYSLVKQCLYQLTALSPHY